MEKEPFYYIVTPPSWEIITNADKRNTIRVSLFICTGIFSLWTGFLTLVGTSMFTYYTAARFKSPYMPWVIFATLMGHMLYLHAYRELFPRPGVVDITGAQMVLVMKVGLATVVF